MSCVIYMIVTGVLFSYMRLRRRCVLVVRMRIWVAVTVAVADMVIHLVFAVIMMLVVVFHDSQFLFEADE